MRARGERRITLSGPWPFDPDRRPGAHPQMGSFTLGVRCPPVAGLSDPGRISATPGAPCALAEAGAAASDHVRGHTSGAWRDVRAEDASANEINLGVGVGRVLSAYE